MDWNSYLYDENEKPLDRLVSGYSHTAIFRTVGFIGDSLSAGEFERYESDGVRRGYDIFPYAWGNYIARKNGLTAHIFSRGGMTAKWYIESFAEEMGYWDKEKACQAYVIALGVNDIYNMPGEIGSIEDVDFADCRRNKPTFAGYYAQIVARYKEVSPQAKFFFVTFPNTASPQRDDRTFGMIDVLYALAEKFDHCYVIDLYRYGPVHDKRFEEKYYLYGHLNPSGYLLTAELIDSYIDYIVRHNTRDFANIGFVGAGIGGAGDDH